MMSTGSHGGTRTTTTTHSTTTIVVVATVAIVVVVVVGAYEAIQQWNAVDQSIPPIKVHCQGIQ